MLEGGLRDRMILESVMNDIVADLTTRGWFDPNREHDPITVVDEFPDDKDDVALNTLAFSLGDTASRGMELGSNAEVLYVPIFADFYAESDGLGRHVVGDIASHAQDVGQFQVYDYSTVGDPAEFIVQIAEDGIDRSKPARAVNAWQKHWHIVAVMVVDERQHA